jgi:predicted dehydrogenase
MTIRIGLLGASRIAPPAVIAPAKAHDGFEVVAVAARDPERAKAYAAEHGIPNVSPDYASLVTRDDVDVVYNALPPAGHAKWTIAALEAGKAVLCEKPFARNEADAEAMVATARRVGRPLLEAAHYRFHTVVLQARKLVEAGTFGRLTRAEATFNVNIPKNPDELRWRADQGGGAQMDLGFYPLHALRTILGAEPKVLSAKADFVDGVDATMSAELDFDGVPAHIECSMVAERFQANLAIAGDNGRLDIANFIAPQLGCRFTSTVGGETTTHATDGPTTYAAQLQHLFEVMDGAPALVGGDDALAHMKAMAAIYRAAGGPLEARPEARS